MDCLSKINHAQMEETFSRCEAPSILFVDEQYCANILTEVNELLRAQGKEKISPLEFYEGRLFGMKIEKAAPGKTGFYFK